MNLYIRFFDRETLVSNADDAVAFLASIDDIDMDEALERDVRDYINGDVRYPKRYKLRPRVYFIIIKTEARTMQEFKDNKGSQTAFSTADNREKAKRQTITHLAEERYGWYEGELIFKRVLQVPGTNKFQYRDTLFVARCKANSGMECYNRIIDELRDRVDRRSQFPSAKGKNFKFKYLGGVKK
jgi:hypothetical protein